MAARESASSYRSHAIVVGILFIIATAFLFIGDAVYGPVLNAENYLELAYPERTTVVVGILLEFACIIAIPLIPVVMFPVLRKTSVTLAVGYVSFRLFEAVLFVLTEIGELSLISVSQHYLNPGVLDPAIFESIGASIQAENQWMFLIYLLLFAIGGGLFYAALYRARLVPRWLAGWGFIAAVLMFVGAILQLLEVPLFEAEGMFELVFATPIAVNEMVLAVWLIVKGFNQAALAETDEDAVEQPALRTKYS